MSELSEEKIIERIKKAIEYDKEHRIVTIYDEKPLFRDVLEALLDLYNKEKLNSFNLSEQLNKEKEKNQKILSDNLENFQKLFAEEISKIYISKDKIKKALGIEDITYEKILNYIDILVSENNRLEDIEDKKVQIEYQNVFNKGVKSVKDKIKEIIKDIDETLNITKSDEAKFFITGLKNSLQELLEESEE